MALPPHVTTGMMLYKTHLGNKTGVTQTEYLLQQPSSPLPLCRLCCEATWEKPPVFSGFRRNQVQAKVLPTEEHP